MPCGLLGLAVHQARRLVDDTAMPQLLTVAVYSDRSVLCLVGVNAYNDHDHLLVVGLLTHVCNGIELTKHPNIRRWAALAVSGPRRAIHCQACWQTVGGLRLGPNTIIIIQTVHKVSYQFVRNLPKCSL